MELLQKTLLHCYKDLGSPVVLDCLVNLFQGFHLSPVLFQAPTVSVHHITGFTVAQKMRLDSIFFSLNSGKKNPPSKFLSQGFP